MSSPGGKPVSQVSVRVVPDVDGFKEKVEAELKKIRDITLTVNLELDDAQVQAELDRLRNEDVTIPVHFNLDNVRDDIKRATSGAQADAVKVPIDLNEAGFEAEIKRVEAQLAELDNKRVTPHVELLQTVLQRQLAELRAELARLSAEKVEIPVGASGIPEVTREVFNLEATLSALEKNPVQIEFDLKDADLRRKIAADEALLAEFDGKTVTATAQLEIDKALARLAAYRIQLSALDEKRIKSILELDIDTIKADARILAFIARMRAQRKINLPVDVDDRSIADTSTRIGRGFSRIGDLLARVFDGVGGSISGVVSNIGSIKIGRAHV